MRQLGVGMLLVLAVTAGGDVPSLWRDPVAGLVGKDVSLNSLTAAGNISSTGGSVVALGIVPTNSINNNGGGAACSGNTGAVCVNDAQGLAITDGAGTTVAVIAGTGKFTMDSTDNSGTPGNTTISKPSGRAAIAAGAAAITVTNTLVTAASNIQATLGTADTTCTFIKSLVPGAGSFVVTVNANCTAATKVNFVVFN